MQPDEGHRRNYRTWLLDELALRKSRNPSYSLRAFSRDLGINSTSLSDVLAAKRHLSKRNALKVADRLALSPSRLQAMLRQISGEEDEFVDDSEFFRLSEDTFAMISEWYYFAILNLATLPENRADERWLAKRLGLSTMEVRGALGRLQRLRLIEIRRGRLRRTTIPLATTNGVPSAALRKYHKQNLQLAADSIDRDPVDLRDVNSITMAIDPAQLAQAKDLIVRFRNRMARVLEGGKPREVYTLAIQLFPVTRPEGNE